LLIPPVGGTIARARFLKTGAKADVKSVAEGVVLSIPKDAVDPFDTVIALELN
jgi:hypothetical protein